MGVNYRSIKLGCGWGVHLRVRKKGGGGGGTSRSVKSGGGGGVWGGVNFTVSKIWG